MMSETEAKDPVPVIRLWLAKIGHYSNMASATPEQFAEARVWVMDSFKVINGELTYQPAWEGRINTDLVFKGMGLTTTGFDRYHPFRLLIDAFTMTTREIIADIVKFKDDGEASHRLMLLYAIRLGSCVWVKNQLFMNVMHHVEPGDTLSQLAEKYGTTILQLMKMNPQIENPDLIYAGAKLRVRV